MYILIILLLSLYQTGRVYLTCTVQNCEPSDCFYYDCGKCRDKYFLTSKGCFPCKSSCSKCSSETQCSECEPYNYGLSCQNRCSGCSDGLCDKSYGACESVCKVGYYKETDNVCRNCPSTCEACDSFNQCTQCALGKFLTEQLSGNRVCEDCPENCYSCTNHDTCIQCNQPHYWGAYCQNNCEHCISDCDKNNGCHSGCINGYYKTYSESKSGFECNACHTECDTCADNVSCLSCSTGFNGSLCQHNCRSCDGQLCDWYTGICSFECSSNQYFDVNIGSCQQCPDGCARCTSQSSCHSCLSGRWGHMCGNICNENCKNNICDKTYGRCFSGCNTGFFGFNCSSLCLPGCQTCVDGYYCTKCKEGYYSSVDDLKCDCQNALCTLYERDECTECSTTEWHPLASGCCPCSNNCENNACFSNKTCINCSPGKYGDQCQYRCSWFCRDRLCYRDGTCISCPDNRYGPACIKYCSTAISRCDKCYGENANKFTCTSCQSGWYVENKNCIRCHRCMSVTGSVLKCNSTTGFCPAGCETGYYGDKCDSTCNVTNCLVCPNPNVCQECKNGFYGETESICTECSPYCRHGMHCNNYNGSCTSGCLDGWSGDQCNQPCPSGCIMCDQYNSGLCGECSEGLYGDKCENRCSPNCNTEDGKPVCNKSNGYCDHGCKDAFWGYACENECGPGCNGSVCNKTTGVCFHGCINKYYGGACKTECSEQCLSREKYSKRTCSYETGECLFGCATGWFGPKCDKKCSEQCKETACERNSGVCTFGCIEGYTGSNCSQAIVLADDDSTDAAAIGGGAGAGIFILVIIAVVVSVLLRGRRQQRTEIRNTCVSQGYNQQDGGYQNLMLNTLDRPAGFGNDSPPIAPMSDVNIEMYQELYQRSLPENTYSTLSAGSVSNAHIGNNMGIDTAAY